MKKQRQRTTGRIVETLGLGLALGLCPPSLAVVAPGEKERERWESERERGWCEREVGV